MLRAGPSSSSAAGARASCALARRPPSLVLLLLAPPTPTALTRRRKRQLGAAASSSSSPSNGTSTSSTSSSSASPSPPAGGAVNGDGPARASTTTTTIAPASTVTAVDGPHLIHASLAARPKLCDGGLPDPEMCLLDDDDPEMRAEELLLLAAEAAAAVPTTTTTTTEQPQPEQQPQIPLPSPLHVPPAPDGTILDEAASRGRWLVGLLVVQSLSSVVLERFEPLIREHLAITLFLTMLVGAGGNAGNQSAIKVVRSLATGQLDASWPSARAALVRQAGVAVVLGGGLAAAGYVRVIAAAATGGLGSGDGDASSTALLWASASRDAAAIAVSLMAIVVASVMLGTALPFLLARCGLDAAHSGTTIQVASDVLGVLVTCLACSFFYSGALDGVTDGIGAALAWVF